MTCKIKHNGFDFQFEDSDVVNPSEYASMVGHDGKISHCYNMRPWVLHDQGFVVAVVFATGEQGAINEAVDAGKLDRWKLTPEQQGLPEYADENEERVSYLGNAGEPFDIEGMDLFPISNPPFSFCALMLNHQNELRHEEAGIDSRDKSKLERENRWLLMWRDTVARCLKEGNLEGVRVACERSFEEVAA